MALILEGKPVRDRLFGSLRSRVEKLKTLHRAPGLAVVLAGNDPASEIYVRNKVKACAELGIYSEKLTPPDTITTPELLAIVEGYNARSDIDGILVQLPLPQQVDTRAILMALAPEKDVDGFHPLNVGNLVVNRPAPRSCTPAGIIELLRHYQIPLAGRNAVVVGRSDTVGKPMALLLLHENATVTVCHSRTADLAAECRRADLLVAATGRPGMITEGFIKPGAVVVDVGIARVNGKITGDVDAGAAAACASAYTPVPGGVGLLTVAMLMQNTVEAAARRFGVCCE